MPYDLAGDRYTTKVSVRRAVRRVMEAHPLDREFESQLLSDLIARYHHRCPLLGLRPIRFRKVTLPQYPTGYELQGYFPQVVDGEVVGWHDVSWTKCLNPPTYDDEVRQFLRRRIQPEIRATLGDQCEECGSTSDLEVDHEEPAFDEMYQRARLFFTQGEVDNWAYHDWLRNDRFELPQGHPVLVAFEAEHRRARLRTLCRSCHRRGTNP